MTKPTPKRKSQPRMILVTGDVTIDWNIARARRPTDKIASHHYIWASGVATRACSHPGGAALIKLLLEGLCKDAAGKYEYNVEGQVVAPQALESPSFGQYTRFYSIWVAQSQDNEDSKVWRVSEFCGRDLPDRNNPVTDGQDDIKSPWAIVVNDTALGFRDDPDSWPHALRYPSAKTAWVLVKAAFPLAKGPLWEHLISHFADRLIVIVPVSTLRKESLQIGYGLSWEQVSSDIVTALKDHPELKKARTIIITMETAGAVVVDRKSGSHLIFDPKAQEGEWGKDYPGSCVGYTTSYITAVVHSSLGKSAFPEFPQSLRRGVNAARALHLSGYGQSQGDKVVDLRFPVESVIKALDQKDTGIVSCKIPKAREGWTILSDYHDLNLKTLADKVVRYGAEKELAGIPYERIGGWSSIDRTEIESIRSLRNIITEYVSHPDPVRPLSIAVFGPPGSGKSTAIKQLTQAFNKLTPLEFNLSQFDSHKELPGGFNYIRDGALRRQLPLVFWDEFDSNTGGRALGWLKYFLVPMQDGEFREAGISHPIGPAIFVFAGGVYQTMESFRKAAHDSPADKGPDFFSRLRGFMDVLGPNRQDRDGKLDEGYILRRALLLRSMLKRNASQLFNYNRELGIDEGVLRAFLHIREYRHGARSLESIIHMSSLSDKLMFERSCLPAPHQLSLHVEASEFLKLAAG
jgi:hypothetical protein